jgi:prolyl oligopeptidase
MAEYGDPSKPEDAKWLAAYSPYQHVDAGADYPPVLLTTSTADDRVHPGHARKMAARLEAMGHRVWFSETVEGGHSGAVDNTKQAQSQALGFAFLRRTICAV